jgi:hypothetical protein
VKQYVSAILFSLVCCGTVQAAAIDLDNHRPVTVPAGVAASPVSSMSELPEPEVFAMMLVGLLLIGYRATRHSSEKFK